MTLSMLGLAVLLQAQAFGSVQSGPVFQSNSCPNGYEWSDAKNKCVKKERDY